MIVTAALLAAAKIYIPVDMVVIILGIFLGVVDILIMFIYLPLLFSSLKYEVSDNELTCISGVFIKSYQSVQFSAVQYTTVIFTPLSQYTGLNFLILFVYGGQLRLLFLKQQDALDILNKTRNKKER